MGFKVICDNQLIYTPELQMLALINPVLDLDIETNGSFKFGMYETHPFYSLPKKLKSMIIVFKGNEMLFVGRILNETKGWHNERMFECEGCKAYLNDSVIEPYDFSSGSNHTSTTELFTYFINKHNEQVYADKRFLVGNVSVIDDYIVKSNSFYQSTWENIKTRLLDSFGGYIVPRFESNGIYLDWVNDFSSVNTQRIQLGVNLKALEQQIDGADIITRVLPLGAKNEETGVYTTIAEVNDGVLYLEDLEAVSTYGKITKVVEFSNITTPSALKTKAQAYLNDAVLQKITLKVSAIDLSNVEDVDALKVGSYVYINSPKHSINTQLLINRMTYNLNNPANDTLTLDKSVKGATSLLNNSGDEIKVVAETSYGIAEGVATEIVEVKEMATRNSTWIEQNGNKVEIVASSVEELEGKVNEQEMHLIVRSDGVYITQTGDITNATKITETGMQIIVANEVVASATNEMFNCRQGLGVKKWNFTEGSNEYIMNITRTGD